MKKLMLLGGSRYLLPVIKSAHEEKIYVITVDYLPDNIAHKYSDKYFNISVTDKKAVLRIAEEEKINGIMSFACDPGVITAAYVAEQLKLPFQGSYDSTLILQDKGLFRQFLQEHNFNVPHAKRYTDREKPFTELNYFTWPVIVKPVDSAGSKGVTCVKEIDKLAEAIETALEESHIGAFIIEDFITFESYHSSTDPFTVDGELKFITYSDQLFDESADNPYAPTMIIWPSSMKKTHTEYLTKEIQRLLNLLDMRSGIYNIETVIGNGGKAYIMEVSPRGGGCKIAELQRMAYGIDLIKNEVRRAVGLPIEEIKDCNCDGYWCEFVMHALPGQSGTLEKIFIDDEIKSKYVKVIDCAVKEGDIILPFTGANRSLGDIFLRFTSREELNEVMSKVNKWLKIEVK